MGLLLSYKYFWLKKSTQMNINETDKKSHYLFCYLLIILIF